MFRKWTLAALLFPLSSCQAGMFTPTAATTPSTLTPTPDAIVIPPPLSLQDAASLPPSEIGHQCSPSYNI